MKSKITNTKTMELFKDNSNLTLPAPIFETMQCEIIEYIEEDKKLVMKIPVLKEWLSPYGTMQGGMISSAMDNAVGALSLLVAPLNVTRSMESKFLKPIFSKLDYMYVQAKLIEKEKRHLFFTAQIEDDKGIVYAKATIKNYIIEDL